MRNMILHCILMSQGIQSPPGLARGKGRRTAKSLGTQASCLREAGWKPANPGAGKMPAFPGAGKMPANPGAGKMPAFPGAGKMPAFPGAGKMPAFPRKASISIHFKQCSSLGVKVTTPAIGIWRNSDDNV